MIGTMANRKLDRQEQEIKSAMMDKIEDAVDDYLDAYRAKSKGGKGIPTINEIEDFLIDLNSKTRDIYLETVSEMISRCNETEMIDSKKENSGKRG